MKYRVHIRKRMEFLHAVMREFESSALISLEGDLSHCRFAPKMVYTHDETTVLRRNTNSPRQEFVVLRLDAGTVEPIFRQMMQAGLTSGILHVQIESDDTLQLGAYDSLHDGCVSVGDGVQSATLDRWKADGLVRDYESAEFAV